MRHTLLLSTAVLVAVGVTAASAADDKDALIKDALSAAPPEIAKTAMVMDWDHSMLKNGSGPYTCMPSDPNTRAKGGRNPMCVDKVWEAWTDALMNKKPFKATDVGIAYMLAGDTGASNIDPYATAATPTNQWVVEGPHVMVIAPDAAQLEGLSTDPHKGGAYVMWKGTPYAHIMVPVAERPKQ
jgi:hypothetical protein